MHALNACCTSVTPAAARLYSSSACNFEPAVASVIFVCMRLAQAMAECNGDLVTNNLTASPVAATALKTMLLKLVMIVVSTCLDEFPQPQAVLMFICPVLSTYLQLSSVSNSLVCTSVL